jgi:hypothetical protein
VIWVAEHLCLAHYGDRHRPETGSEITQAWRSSTCGRKAQARDVLYLPL